MSISTETQSSDEARVNPNEVQLWCVCVSTAQKISCCCVFELGCDRDDSKSLILTDQIRWILMKSFSWKWSHGAVRHLYMNSMNSMFLMRLNGKQVLLFILLILRCVSSSVSQQCLTLHSGLKWFAIESL